MGCRMYFLSVIEYLKRHKLELQKSTILYAIWYLIVHFKRSNFQKSFKEKTDWFGYNAYAFIGLNFEY
jgi:hypothetical protein